MNGLPCQSYFILRSLRELVVPVGIFLLNDKTCSRMNIFRKEYLGKPEDMQEWLEGKGLPVT